MGFRIEYLCRNGRTWRELQTATGAPVETENRRDAEALARQVFDLHRRPARVVNDMDRPVYSVPSLHHAQ